MRKYFLSGTILCACISTIPQNSFETTLHTGFAFPFQSKDILSPHNGTGAQIGNHFNYMLSAQKIRLGFGGFAGQVLSFSTSDYKLTAQQLATKYRMTADKLNYKQSAFKSSSFLAGPVADVSLKNWSANIWAKGGYSINEPAKFAATYIDNGVNNTIYKNISTSGNNGFAYNLGAGIRYHLTSMLGLQLAASYFDTKTELINYNFDREKGTAPLSFSANNNFLQASLGLTVSIMGKERGVKRENVMARKNERHKNTDEDTVYFVPRYVITHQTQRPSFGEKTLHPINNYLTAFLYNTDEGLKISQCSGMRRPGEPIPGIDVRLVNINSSQNYAVRTHDDGSFSAKDITDGIYHAIIATDTAVFVVENSSVSADYRLVVDAADECGSVTSNINYADEKCLLKWWRPETRRRAWLPAKK